MEWIGTVSESKKEFIGWLEKERIVESGSILVETVLGKEGWGVEWEWKQTRISMHMCSWEMFVIVVWHLNLSLSVFVRLVGNVAPICQMQQDSHFKSAH